MKRIKSYLTAMSIPVILYLIMMILAPKRFGSGQSIYNILVQSIVPALIGYSMSFGQVAGLMDFTVGSRAMVSSICGGILSLKFGFFGLLFGCLITSTVLGITSGLVYRFTRIPSFVISLGLVMVFEIIGAMILSLVNNTTTLPSSAVLLRQYPYNFIVLIVMSVIFYMMFYHTKFAYQVRAVGGDETIASNAGIKPMRVKTLCYFLGGPLLGMAALMQSSYSGLFAAQINMLTLATVFRPMMGVMIGIELMELCCLPVGIYIGSVSLNVLYAGIIALGWEDALQNVFVGLFMLIIMVISNNKPTINEFALRLKQRIGKNRIENIG